MNAKGSKKLERLVDKMMKETALETPSVNFTGNIMSQVEVMANSEATTYKSLISKPVWAGLFAVVIGALAYSFFNTTPESSWLATVDLSSLTNTGIGNTLSNLVSSKTILYSVVLFAMMFAVQISVLKVYFNKRLGV